MNYHINNFNRAKQEQNRNLKSKQPKDFGKLINDTDTKKKKPGPAISLDTLYVYFKNLNQNVDATDNAFDVLNIDLSDNEDC